MYKSMLDALNAGSAEFMKKRHSGALAASPVITDAATNYRFGDSGRTP